VLIAREADHGNRLLAVLPTGDRRRVMEACDTIDLVASDILWEVGGRIRHVYFPTAGFVSLVTVDESSRLEIGLVGNEGMLGTPLVLGIVTSTVQALVQGAGPALRMDAAVFRAMLSRSDTLSRVLDRYLLVLMIQLAQMAACTRFHLLEGRLARWLLMTRDRAGSNAFHITHELLALMLGVRRVGVTRAAASLQRRGLIRYSRGDMSVLDRRGLDAASCRCYRADLRTYERVLSRQLAKPQ